MIDFTLGICCLSRDFPADTRRLTTDWVESDACAVVFQLCHLAAYCIGSQWLERAVDCNQVLDDVARSINLYLGKHEILGAFHC